MPRKLYTGSYVHAMCRNIEIDKTSYNIPFLIGARLVLAARGASGVVGADLKINQPSTSGVRQLFTNSYVDIMCRIIKV